jgi:amino acid adenylation domain-containing protein
MGQADRAEQERIRGRCFHPSGHFVEFTREAVEQSIPARFEDQARRHAGRVAVRTRDRTLTYAELNAAANRLAHAILARRGPSQEPVALLLPRGTLLPVGIFGALKAGKIFLSLDPVQPRARIAQILEDAGAELIVAGGEYTALAAELATGAAGWIDAGDLPDGLAIEDPGVAVSADSFSSLFYTSGSTGRPKGVVEDHRTTLFLTRVQTNEYHISCHDRLTFLGSRRGDLYRALLNGAALYPVDLRSEGAAGTVRWMLEEEITVYNSVVSAFRQICDALTGSERFPALRLIKLMGEQVYASDLELYRRYFPPGCVFSNSLGSTEAGFFASFFADRDTAIAGTHVPVGYEAEGSEARLLDEEGRDVGVGEPGEITVSSRFLATGYWRQPELTRAAFQPDPSGGDARIYRTGDLGYRLPDGCLVHLGRKDLQVKVRGNRVEVAEVEQVLLAQDNVGQAVVVARQDVPGEVRLVAYVVPTQAPAPPAGALRRAVAAALPSYMIPSAFVTMDALPLLPIGKVDRLALPAPPRERPPEAGHLVAPRTPIEERLERIWAEALGLPEVGVHDDFLELGGHSLVAARIVSRARVAFQLDAPVRTLLEAPTIADMALLIVTDQAGRVAPERIDRILADLDEPGV